MILKLLWNIQMICKMFTKILKNIITTMLKSSLCDYSDAYMLIKRTTTVDNTAAEEADANNENKKVIFKNCAPFTDCISEINNTQVDNDIY